MIKSLFTLCGASPGQAVERMLREAGVRYLTTPAMASLAAPMWGRAFGFTCLTSSEAAALETRHIPARCQMTLSLHTTPCRCRSRLSYGSHCRCGCDSTVTVSHAAVNAARPTLFLLCYSASGLPLLQNLMRSISKAAGISVAR